jgi:hypothetical protein
MSTQARISIEGESQSIHLLANGYKDFMLSVIQEVLSQNPQGSLLDALFEAFKAKSKNFTNYVKKIPANHELEWIANHHIVITAAGTVFYDGATV